MTSVYNILFEGRKKQVKPAPTVLLSALVAEAAETFGVDAQLCSLKLKNKVLDLSQSVRFAGIPNHSNLDLFVKVSSTAFANAETKVLINVNGGASQLSASLPSNTTLLDVLQHFVLENHLPSTILEPETKIELLYIRTPFSTVSQLQQTTLASLGLAGQAGKLQLRYTSPSSDVPSHALSDNSTNNGITSVKDDAIRAECETMDVEEPVAVVVSESSSDPATNPPAKESNFPEPPMQSVVDNLLQRNFDAVSRHAVLTLHKYLSNLLRHLLEDVTYSDSNAPLRSINLQNKVFCEKVAPAIGAMDVLLGVGYVQVSAQRLVYLPTVTEVSVFHRELLQTTLNLLTEAMDTLEIPVEQRSRPSPQATAVGVITKVPVVAFDPFRSLIVRTSALEQTGQVEVRVPRQSVAAAVDGDGQPQQQQNLSVTESKLQQLRRKREELLGEAGSVPHQTLVVFPGDASSSYASTSSNSKSFSMDNNDVDSNDNGKSSLPRSVLQRTLKALSGDGSSDAPLVTKAVRELQALQSERVYTETVLRVRLPDAVQLIAHFHPRDTIGDVYLWLARHCLAIEPVSSTLAHDNLKLIEWLFTNVCELYTTPPRTTLSPIQKTTSKRETSSGDEDSASSPSQTLQEAGLVPAAVLHLQWREGAMSSAFNISADSSNSRAKGWYLQENLLTQSSTKASFSSSSTAATASAEATPLRVPQGVKLTGNDPSSFPDSSLPSKGLDAESDDKSSTQKKPAPASKPKWFKM